MKKILTLILILTSTIIALGFSLPVQAVEKCTIQSTKFNPSGNQATSWYKSNNPPQIRIDVSTKNCIGKSFEISITEKDSVGPDDDVTEIENRKISTTSDNFSLNYKTGESECETLGTSPECEYYVSITNISDGGSDYSSEDKNELSYDCEGICDMLGNNWSWLGNATPVGTPIPPTNTNTNPTTTTYTPLAPLPGLTTFDASSPTALSNYINIIIKLTIGIAAVLAVLMIIMGGLEYITSELPGAKGEGKQRITNAVVGLLIALGAWIILNTINPNLLNTDLSSLTPTTIQFDDEVETPPSASLFDSSAPSGPMNLCTEGVERISTSGGGFTVCKRISANVQSMINLAWSQGYKIAGWGYRSRAQQIRLRIQHCGENNPFNVYQKLSSQCQPPTARPGASRHESGLAIDLTCDGVSIQSTDNRCFIWLKNNAGRYGLSNLSSEPWHWSVDGK